ncbi:MAG: hypothetical protein IPI00_03875 [Flavobacteriales bacterium]|nr:hypothetical protein [Flavobacteriales bacterium]MBK6944964.1 hypothetical protein [Flavobacteriales bacterium]MBK7239313.1 hypothetical protein [Flavobacteriales bacterium]MBK7297405.1 hypothetical protein [Flavobacteriales bacterium]
MTQINMINADKWRAEWFNEVASRILYFDEDAEIEPIIFNLLLGSSQTL